MTHTHRALRTLFQTGTCAAVLALAAVTSASADSVTDVGTFPPGQVPTRVTNINGPSNAQQTSFTGYTGGGPYNYRVLTLTVSQTGTYTASSTTTNVVNTTWILNGIFSPSNTAPATPLSAYIVAVLSGFSPNTGNFTGFNLVAGQQYSVLVAYNTGAVSGDVSTMTVSGPGCVSLGGSAGNCAQGVPTLSEWGKMGMAGLLGLTGLFAVSRATRVRRRKA